MRQVRAAHVLGSQPHTSAMLCPCSIFSTLYYQQLPFFASAFKLLFHHQYFSLELCTIICDYCKFKSKKLNHTYAPNYVAKPYACSIQTFNKIQTQVFQALYTSDDNVFIGAPTGSDKTSCAEFALLRLWSKREPPRAVCIEPYQEMVDLWVNEQKAKSGKLQGGKEVVSLSSSSMSAILCPRSVLIIVPYRWINA